MTCIRHTHIPLTDGVEEEVDEPGEGVLVHGVDVGEVSDGEEENGAVGSHRTIASTRLLQLLLCLLCNLREGERGGGGERE